MTIPDLEKGYTYKLNNMPRGKNINVPITNSCNVPYRHVVVDFNSNCLICECDAWLPIPVGKVSDFDSLQDLFNSPIARILQQDIDDKKFTWCAVEYCNIKNQNIIKNKFELAINIDESCNLYCPSCRRDPIMHTIGPEVEKKQQDINRIMLWLKNFNEPIHIILSGNGDPLASTVIRPLIKNYQPKTNQTFRLFTNGLLLKKQLENSPLLPNITEFFISIDAGSADVYEKVRRGGSWKVLIENLQYLKALQKENKVQLNFAVQNSNWHDLSNFVDLCLSNGFRANIHQLDDWGTWNPAPVDTPDTWTIINGTYLDHDVLNQSHLNYVQCKNTIKKLITQHAGKPVNFSPKLLQLLAL
jgi:molybdenum cofactor biosynthesis enzyme MoaA